MFSKVSHPWTFLYNFLYLFSQNAQKTSNIQLKSQDCKKAVTGKSFYAMEGLPVCPGCVGVDDEDQ